MTERILSIEPERITLPDANQTFISVRNYVSSIADCHAGST